MYLDYNWKTVKDSSKAVYWRYTYFAHGKEIYNMGNRGGKSSKYDPVNDTTDRKGKLIMLNGEYKTYEKGKLKYINVLMNGEYVSYIEYDKSGNAKTSIDYTKKCRDEPNSFTVYVYKKNRTEVFCFYNGPYGWMGYGYSNADSVKTETLKVIGDSTFYTQHVFKNGKLINEYSEIKIKKADGKTETIKHGHTTSWYLNGQKKEEGNYYYGKKIGNWKRWDEKGKENKGENSP